MINDCVVVVVMVVVVVVVMVVFDLVARRGITLI